MSKQDPFILQRGSRPCGKGRRVNVILHLVSLWCSFPYFYTSCGCTM